MPIRLLHRRGGKIVSEYRTYGGEEDIGSYIRFFRVATVDVEIDDDFRVSSAIVKRA